MADTRSPPNAHHMREQRAAQAALMKGYATALAQAYRAEDLPAHMARLLEQLERRERR